MTATAGWKAVQVYTLAAVCLVLGLALGYLFRGSQSAPTAASAGALPQGSAQPAAMGGQPTMPTLDQMKHMADKKAEPVLQQLKSDPTNAKLLIQVGQIYESTHQFKNAANYFEKSLEINPKDTATRTEMASCLFYNGEVDAAISQLQTVLQDQPKDVNALFNLGMMKWKEKKDASGALAAWRELLKSNPQLEDAKKTQVQKMIAEASQPQASN